MIKKKIKDDQWEQVRQFILNRDKTCRIWNILTNEEKSYIKTKWLDDYRYLSSFLDCCHIIPRSVKKSLFYEHTNIVLCSRFFHSRLDEFRHPVYDTKIDRQERINWFSSALNGNRNLLNE